jgi:myo-inositol-1(or 4)-monophosphatase
MSDIDIEELIVWARESGDIALRMFRNVVGQRKADHSWVTEADLTIERMLAARIAERFPDHGIIGEEQTRQALDQEFLWALDPLDGTAVFLAGLATWGISIGLLRGGQPYLGVLYFPLLEDCYWSLPGGGAFMNDQPIQVAPPHTWDSDDWLATPSNVHRRYTIDFVGKSRSIGATIGTFCYVARGSAIGGLLNRFAIWDIAAALAVLRAAGGVALGLDGAPLDTAAMLDGRTLDTPMLLGSLEHVRMLQNVVHLREPKVGHTRNESG